MADLVTFAEHRRSLMIEVSPRVMMWQDGFPLSD